MNMIRGAKTDEEMERVDGYLKAHCPVAHGYQIGGMCELAPSPLGRARRHGVGFCADAAPIMETASPERRIHLRQLHERHKLVWPDETSEANHNARL